MDAGKYNKCEIVNCKLQLYRGVKWSRERGRKSAQRFWGVFRKWGHVKEG